MIHFRLFNYNLEVINRFYWVQVHDASKPGPDYQSCVVDLESDPMDTIGLASRVTPHANSHEDADTWYLGMGINWVKKEWIHIQNFWVGSFG